MGLAAPRKRTKISHDPNNTAWARSTSGYGHKIMSAQGWTPGSFLGASNAPHAADFTKASAGHIRVILKDDTLGLGAKPRAEDEPTGLDAFQGLLGRLNGKNDAELELEQKKKDDRRLASFVERRWKTMRFVSGGLLVQEKVHALSEKEEKNNEEKAEKAEKEEKAEETEKSEKSKKERKKEKKKSKSDDSTSDPSEDLSKKKKKEKKERKEKKEKKRSRDDLNSSDSTPSEDAETDKKSKKPKKRKQKDLETKEPEDTASDTLDDEKSPKKKEKTSSVAAKPDSIVKVKEHRPLGRQFIRGRHIQQKKSALMDAKSLNEVLVSIFHNMTRG
ncbi:hypothetical protein AJ79_00170 [Helicocarpus griseus UAMH5409]|uniref:Protein PXR1 n=1 Tax=Helicocarpus griseus UAMH5409 TaxID=1447875 RepID=A0A2B7YDS7_9EURO|nr:hypothetical protein AJ79_00170 [Helicocarpus griseus UAMH5409]